ncbi:MAG: hypothetical protein QXG65_01590 [Thermoplasmata archaeon]
MGRTLTAAQARAIGAILSQDRASTKERVRASGLPPRTFQAAQARATEAAWVAERIVPDPVLFGRPRVTIAWARPAPGDPGEIGPRWQQLDDAALVWAGPDFVFAVCFDPEEGETPIAAEMRRGKARYRRTYRLEASLRTPALPVYFDFEAEWSQIAGIPGMVHYPRPFPRAPRGAPRPAPSPRWREIVDRLVRSDGVLAPLSEPGAPGLIDRLTLRRAAVRAFASGWVDARAFLNPVGLPSVGGWTPANVVFVQGRLKANRRPEVLLRTLIVGCRVHPFLFATDGAELLFATLSPAPGGIERAVPVAPTLDRFLERITVLREPIEGLAALVPHRYEVITAPASGARAGRALEESPPTPSG